MVDAFSFLFSLWYLLCHILSFSIIIQFIMPDEQDNDSVVSIIMVAQIKKTTLNCHFEDDYDVQILDKDSSTL